MIHRGNLAKSRTVMGPYLPSAPSAPTRSPYSEGGALYALGLIHANHGQDVRQFLLDSLRATQHEVVQHGACLGLGLAGLGTGDEEVFEDLKNVLYMDNAGGCPGLGGRVGGVCGVHASGWVHNGGCRGGGWRGCRVAVLGCADGCGAARAGSGLP